MDRAALSWQRHVPLSSCAQAALYQACKDAGITLLSIGHRPAIKKFHSAVIHFQARLPRTCRAAVSTIGFCLLLPRGAAENLDHSQLVWWGLDTGAQGMHVRLTASDGAARAMVQGGQLGSTDEAGWQLEELSDDAEPAPMTGGNGPRASGSE